ncbi:EF-P beta-lysylation protein EpmB [Pantoea sp. Mhis]|uniref:EF-P beta-lysylation protein EpmB n=1 Tax=Pantoea sp. Mhis TaxID=2576759 RepID=UPI0013595432|nr:EF-P beta-lysylation protein EpmB [Pantoea sp. Mhis]MXP56763.1 EF-P beta-lysylation protein EpmB [Pantoea sp. Mhis]
MIKCITKYKTFKENWLYHLNNSVTNPYELLELLSLNQYKSLILGTKARILFPLRVPRKFIKLMTIGNPQDPLLLQVITNSREFDNILGYSSDPLNEQNNIIPGLLHKYKNRVLMLVKGSCAINCRYCFRRHFPYHNNQGNKTNWQMAINYINMHSELDEIIFSGGDPLMAKDSELSWLINMLANIAHIKRLRIHTRLPIVIPERITNDLCHILDNTRLQVLLVTHINHMQEISNELYHSMKKLRKIGVTLLNQSVLLRNINDNVQTLANLNNSLFDIGILPYYLHVLDKVQGTAHFFVSDEEARKLVRQLLTMLSGYLIPKLTREISGKPSKIPLDLELSE